MSSIAMRLSSLARLAVVPDAVERERDGQRAPGIGRGVEAAAAAVDDIGAVGDVVEPGRGARLVDLVVAGAARDGVVAGARIDRVVARRRRPGGRSRCRP